MSRALYYLRHRNTPEVFPVTNVLFPLDGSEGSAAAHPGTELSPSFRVWYRFDPLESQVQPPIQPGSNPDAARV
jgi:hypothetical protein